LASVVLCLTSFLLRLHKLLGDVVISQGGVVPFIQPELLPSATKKGKKGESQEV
jgi:histone H2A